jgi:2-polyprenyl-3-methyl-5-hydroxy-6-metoxy-1,4-benzoquinol methylase
MNIQNFTNTFLSYIKPNNQVLDLGAGEGKFTQMFLNYGAIVTAVDMQPPVFHDNRLTVKKMEIKSFCASEKNKCYDLIFARNVIQFLDKNWVFETLIPWIEDHLAQRGIVAIKTFYQNPEPPFNRSINSLYTLKDLNLYFMAWKELYAKEYSCLGFDMSGQKRKFFVSSLIVQKNIN